MNNVARKQPANFDGIRRCSIGGLLDVQTGVSEDEIRISETTIGKNAIIKTGGSNDILDIFRVTCSRDLEIRTGSGVDDVRIYQYRGNDVLNLEDSAFRISLFVDGGLNHDTGNHLNCTFGKTRFSHRLEAGNLR